MAKGKLPFFCELFFSKSVYSAYAHGKLSVTYFFEFKILQCLNQQVKRSQLLWKCLVVIHTDAGDVIEGELEFDTTDDVSSEFPQQLVLVSVFNLIDQSLAHLWRFYRRMRLQ